MNTIKVAALALASISGVWAQGPTNITRYPAQITFRVLTDQGEPVSNVEVMTSTFLRWQPGESFGQDIYETTKVKTDADGLGTVRFTSERRECNYGIYDMPGYYSTRNLVYLFEEVRGEHWEPWSPTVDIVLKPIIKPIPMYARSVGQIGHPVKIPLLNKPVGFDLMVGDWVGSDGKGRTADLVFTLHEQVRAREGNDAFEYTLTIAFSNTGDGVQSVLAMPFKGSELRLPRYAPETGYETELVKRIGRSESAQPIYPTNREDQNYFFRVRTVLDEKGRIKRALYGKIMGDVRFGVNRSVQFTYYLNPESLDRNMEFDPRRNLFERLSSLEQVNEP